MSNVRNQALPKESLWLTLVAAKASGLGGTGPAPDTEVTLMLEASVHVGEMMCSWH